MQKPDNEVTNESIRRTVDNRELKYVLNVLQEPARARACGNGPRASSDRRPVDPPPVVQLKVYDLADGAKDVTMTYDSDFMLYASLEVARPIANGRMQSPPHPPVLTGVAVASAAYLDRPSGPSGYFIFPDLSVRHEGWYRLKFSLFEAVKHPQDADHDRPFNPIVDTLSKDSKQPVAHEAMANRMEVASTPFQVFSAKKFPGLDQSTAVSKALAEQGCRVRIRRDIRQRKRAPDDKAKSENSDRATPDLYAIEEHTRTHSMDSQYQDMRRGSVDSHYIRPTPSRQLSIASMTQPSPITPGTSQMPMAPPPMQRPSFDASYSAASRFDPRWSMSQSTAPFQTLPPPMMPPTNGYGNPARPKQYDIPDARSQKRSRSPAEYNQTDAMKHGARPDTAPPQPWQAPKPDDVIEPDDNDDDDDVDWLSFRRAEGRNYARKTYTGPGAPHGMENLLG